MKTSKKSIHPYVMHNFRGTEEVQKLLSKIDYDEADKGKLLMTDEEWKGFCKLKRS